MLPPPLQPHRSLPREIASTLGAYITGQAKISLILVGLYAVGFGLVGMQLWLLLAVLCAAVHMVPVAGSLIGLALAEVAMLTGDGDIYHCLWVLAVWVLVEAIESFWLTPRILGRRLQLSPWLVFAVVIAGGMVFGPIGVLLATPVAAVGAVIYRSIRQKQLARRSDML